MESESSLSQSANEGEGLVVYISIRIYLSIIYLAIYPSMVLHGDFANLTSLTYFPGLISRRSYEVSSAGALTFPRPSPSRGRLWGSTTRLPFSQLNFNVCPFWVLLDVFSFFRWPFSVSWYFQLLPILSWPKRAAISANKRALCFCLWAMWVHTQVHTGM